MPNPKKQKGKAKKKKGAAQGSARGSSFFIPNDTTEFFLDAAAKAQDEGRWADAIHYLQLVLNEPHAAAHPGAYWGARMNYGVCLAQLNDTDAAEEALKESIAVAEGCEMAPRRGVADAHLAYGHFLRTRRIDQLGTGLRAMHEFQRAVEIDPLHTSAHYHLAVAAEELGGGYDIQLANDCYETVLRLDPNHREARDRLIRLQRAKVSSERVENAMLEGKWAEAAELLRLALQGPDAAANSAACWGAWINLGSCLSQLNDVDAGHEAFQKAFECIERHSEALPHDVSQAHIAYGNFLHNADDKQAALQEFQKAAQIDPTHAEAHYLLGFVTEATGGDVLLAAVSYAEALRLDPNYSEARDCLSELREKHKLALVDLPAAEALYEEDRWADVARLLKPWWQRGEFGQGETKARASVLLSMALMDLEDPDEEAVLREGIEVDGQNSTLRLAMGRVLAKREEWDSAKTEFIHAIALLPDNALAHVGLANVCLSLKDFVYADAEFTEAVHILSPDGHVPNADEYEDVSDGMLAEVLTELYKTRNFVRFHSSLSGLCDIPAKYVCPLSLQLMVFPVVASDGHHYERWFLRKWLDSDAMKRSPMTLEPLDVSATRLDGELRDEIRVLLIENTPALREGMPGYASASEEERRAMVNAFCMAQVEVAHF